MCNARGDEIVASVYGNRDGIGRKAAPLLLVASHEHKVPCRLIAETLREPGDRRAAQATR